MASYGIPLGFEDGIGFIQILGIFTVPNAIHILQGISHISKQFMVPKALAKTILSYFFMIRTSHAMPHSRFLRAHLIHSF
jgi:hypothetical protein